MTGRSSWAKAKEPKPVGKRRVSTKDAALALWRESAKVETGERLQYALEMVAKLESEVGRAAT